VAPENPRALAEGLVAGWPDLKVLYIIGYAEEAIERQGALPTTCARRSRKRRPRC
jgi:hypothetical protein